MSEPLFHPFEKPIEGPCPCGDKLKFHRTESDKGVEFGQWLVIHEERYPGVDFYVDDWPAEIGSGFATCPVFKIPTQA